MKHPRLSLARSASKLPLLSACLVACAFGFACGSDDDGPGGPGGGTGSGSGDGDATGGGANGDGDGDSSSGDGDGDSSNDALDGACGLSKVSEQSESELAELIKTLEEQSCTAESYEGEALAADIFIMLDQSTSMGEHHVIEDDPDSPTRWEALTEGLKAFLNSDGAKGLRIGIQYFGLPGADDQAQSCDVDEYATPDVEIGALPGNAEALTDSIDDHSPSNLTPSVPALEGALKYARQWAIDNPGRPTVVIFATDGFPTVCDRRSVEDLEKVAAEYAHPEDPTDPDTPPITTYVVGVGEDVTGVTGAVNLERVAEAGGTDRPFLVGACPTAVDDLTAALERVANSPALCRFSVPELPEGQFLDPDAVSLVFNPDEGLPEFVRPLGGPGNCGSGGWYYDDKDDPQEIIVCPETCSQFGGGEVNLFIGCETPDIR